MWAWSKSTESTAVRVKPLFCDSARRRPRPSSYAVGNGMNPDTAQLECTSGIKGGAPPVWPAFGQRLVSIWSAFGQRLVSVSPWHTGLGLEPPVLQGSVESLIV